MEAALTILLPSSGLGGKARCEDSGLWIGLQVAYDFTKGKCRRWGSKQMMPGRAGSRHTGRAVPVLNRIALNAGAGFARIHIGLVRFLQLLQAGADSYCK